MRNQKYILKRAISNIKFIHRHLWNWADARMHVAVGTYIGIMEVDFKVEGL